MRRYFSAFCFVGGLLATVSCQGGTDFKAAGKLGSSIDATKAKIILDPGGLNRAIATDTGTGSAGGGGGTGGSGGTGSTGPSDAETMILPCEAGSGVGVSSKAASLNIPVVCSKEETLPAPQFNDMDMVFVLDTTGSMQPYVKMVRENIQEIAASAQRNGYTVRFGALSFGDEIYDTQPLTEDGAALMAAMADTNPKWKPTSNRGGLATEIGLGAIEAGLELLGSGSSHSKTLVYFSDGPAKLKTTDRDSLLASFGISHTVEAVGSFARRIQSQSGIFRMISGTSCQRGDSWYDEWPTPCLQMVTLARSAGVKFLPLTFPMSNVGYDQEFLTKVESKPTNITVDCTLDSVSLQTSSGQVLIPEVKIPAGTTAQVGLWSAPIEKALEVGSYTGVLKRMCRGVAEETKYSIAVR